MMASCDLHLPVIDLNLLLSSKSGGSNDEQLELEKLRDACSELGFFHIINHGIDPNLIQTLDSISRDMFALPTDIKEKAIFPIYFTGYDPSKIDPLGKGDSMPESMVFPTAQIIDEISAKLWPEGNQKSREAIQKYMSEMIDLSHKMLKLIIYSLGVDVVKHFGSVPFEKYLRMNLYHNQNAEAGCHNEIFYKAHTDLACLAILYQDDIGGLQIRTKEGQWVDTQPIPGSFVVNIGDSLQMWSNDRYRSSEHRVVHGGSKRTRLSIAFFLLFPDEAEIIAPPELISEEHPQIYRAVTTHDLKVHAIQVGPSLGGSLADLRLL